VPGWDHRVFRPAVPQQLRAALNVPNKAKPKRSARDDAHERRSEEAREEAQLPHDLMVRIKLGESNDQGYASPARHRTRAAPAVRSLLANTVRQRIDDFVDHPGIALAYLKAAAEMFDAWRAGRGTVANDEPRQILRQVSDFIDRHGDSRFSEKDAYESPKFGVKGCAGWWRCRKACGVGNGSMAEKNCRLPASKACWRASRNKRRNSRLSTSTGRKKFGREEIQRVPSGERPPPATTICKCGW
jgi:hypothetical protein